jgi:hypothetical protein
MDAECTIDGCDYRAPVRSVEAHISGSTSGGHEGEVGRHHRDVLVERAEASANGDGDVAESLDGTETNAPLDVADGATSEGGLPEVAGPAALAGSLSPITVMAVLSVGALLYLSYRTATPSTETTADGGEPGALDREAVGGIA